MKTEELNALKNEVKALNKKLAELTDEELSEVVGGLVLRDVTSRRATERCDKVTNDNYRPQFYFRKSGVTDIGGQDIESPAEHITKLTYMSE